MPPTDLTTVDLNLSLAEPARSVAKPSTLPERLRADLTLLARPRHAHWDPMGLLAVRSLLRERLGALGELEEQAFQRGAARGVNLVLKLPDQDPGLSPLLIGAHYDGAPQTPGADDNASGVAALLELARRWSARAPRPAGRCGWWPSIRRRRVCSAVGLWRSGCAPTDSGST